MNKLWTRVKAEVINGKKLYTFLILMLIIGVVCGSLFITILSNDDRTIVTNQLVSFFTKVKSNNIDFLLGLKNSISSNILYVLFIWLLGISVIGIPIIIFIVFFKGFIIGFSIVSIIMKYKIAGVLGAATYIFPHLIISALMIVVLSCYALYFSFNLFWSIVQRKSINFKNIINHYSWILLVSMIVMIIASLIEVFVSPYIIKLFLLFVKP